MLVYLELKSVIQNLGHFQQFLPVKLYTFVQATAEKDPNLDWLFKIIVDSVNGTSKV